MSNTETLYKQAIDLLSQLIFIPSFSREENKTADCIEQFFRQQNIAVQRIGNNVICRNQYFTESKPSILLNSHHDTVKPNVAYTKDPFHPQVENGKLYGLGSNDAGGCLVSLLMVFLHYYHHDNLNYNLIYAATAEEEISGSNGIQLTLPHLQQIDFAIVGEPTLMQMAVAERGLMVLDCKAKGRAGHAARGEGDNAIYKAIQDVEWCKHYQFEKVSKLLGPVKMSVTSITTENKAHNVVPAECDFIVDVRVNELYTMEEVLQTIEQNLQSEVVTRSTRLKSSSISPDHPIVKAGMALGKSYYGSPTTSDKALMTFPALKIGPGDSARSHMADEFIFLKEIEEGIEFYMKLLKQVLL